MTKTANFTAIAALLAASAFTGSAALASGDYYQGASPEQTQLRQNVDRSTTQSIGNDAYRSVQPTKDVGPANGDYYQGVNKN